MKTHLFQNKTTWLFILLMSISFIQEAKAQQRRYYNLQTDFRFKPAKFKKPLFEGFTSIKGVFKDKLIIETDWNNKPTIMLVDTLGNIIYNFEKNYKLPQNYATENGFWMVSLDLLEYAYKSDTLILAYFDAQKSKLTEKKFGVGSENHYMDNTKWVGKIKDHFLFCYTNIWDFTILNFEDNSTQILPNVFYSHYISDVTFDKDENKFRALGLRSYETNQTINLYEFKTNEKFDIEKHLVWEKPFDKFSLKGFHAMTFDAQNEILIQGSFTDSTVIAKSFDLKGNATSAFDIPYSLRPAEGVYLYNSSILHLKNLWYYNYPYYYNYTSNYNNLSFIKRDSTVQLLFDGIPLPISYDIQNDLYFSQNNAIAGIDLFSTTPIFNIHYKIPNIEKAIKPQYVITNPDSTYWVIYENKFWAKYKGTTELFRSDSAYTNLYIQGRKKMPDSSLWVPIFGKLDESVFLRVGKDNSFRLINIKQRFGSGAFMYFDKYKQQIYLLSDSLRRYNWDGTEDKSLKCEVPASKIGSMLVNVYGSIYIGNNPQGWPPDLDPHTYKLDYFGKILQTDLLPKCIDCFSNGGTNINFFIPYYEKQDMIVWGGLLCAEGCYIGNMYVRNEKNEKIETIGLGGGTSFLEGYGLIIGNNSFFINYDSTKQILYRDENLKINLPDYGNSDILPNGDILTVTQNSITLFSLKLDSSIVTRITNLENQPDAFFNKKIVDVVNQELPLHIITSDGSAVDLWFESENENIARIQNKTLIFGNSGGSFRIFAQSVHGGLPFISKTFTIRQETIELKPSLSPLLLNQAIYFTIIEPIDYDYWVKVDSVSGNCTVEGKQITGTQIGKNGCTVYYSWPANNYYLAGHGVVTFDIVDVLLGTENQAIMPGINYPNPMEKVYFVVETTRSIGTIRMYNGAGQAIMINTKIDSNKAEIYPQTQEPGIYFVQLFDKNNHLIGTLKQLIN